MNERIKLLAEQAGMTDDKFGMFFAKDKHDEDGVDLEKFAELIVRECVQTLINNTPERYASEDDWDRGYARAIEDCVHHIQEHFGVEE
jgi:hypothetical protein